MGEVGGNGSVVWKNTHVGGGAAAPQFNFRPGAGQLGPRELRRGAGGAPSDIQGRDNIAIDDIDTAARVDDPELAGFHKKKYFLVRLRFDGPEATAIQNWFAATPPAALPQSVRIFTEGNSLVMAIRVKAVQRGWPANDVDFADMPWEIRYDW